MHGVPHTTYHRYAERHDEATCRERAASRRARVGKREEEGQGGPELTPLLGGVR